MITEQLPEDKFAFEHTYVAFDADNIMLEVGNVEKIYAYKSVTKPIAAWGILVAIEQGKFELDTPAGPDGSTFRHLLSHASGLPPEEGDPIAKPGRRRIYSNYGFDVMADEAEKYLDVSIQDWIQSEVLDPLGMNSVRIVGTIAHSGTGCARCLVPFGREVLKPTLISRELAEKAFQSQFAGIPGVTPGYGRSQNNPWGLGFSIRNPLEPHWTGEKFSNHVVGHFGMSGSFFYMDLSKGKGGAFLGTQDFNKEHIQHWPALADAMIEIDPKPAGQVDILFPTA
ncbi:MAG: beta-lactamase family protein [Trueperella sp.]|nr:beta-lactamase family protein [Trueperella sp.]